MPIIEVDDPILPPDDIAKKTAEATANQVQSEVPPSLNVWNTHSPLPPAK